ncbi:hypothetical protein ACSVDM_22470 [Nocardia sp. JW2]
MAGTRCPTGPLIVRVLEGHGVEETSSGTELDHADTPAYPCGSAAVAR